VVSTIANEPAVTLPDPDSHPDAPVIIWDGDCNFCRAQVERLQWYQGTRSLSYISLHDPRVAERYPFLTHQQLMEQIWVVLPDDQAFGGADAIRFLSRYLPRLWWMAPALHLPLMMPIWRKLYKIVAQRRYAIAGKHCDEGGTCHLHTRNQESPSAPKK
jgi:predicted DCC family thiol-disulfide oxidoreductase YuxK